MPLTEPHGGGNGKPRLTFKDSPMKKHVLDGYNTVFSVEWCHRDGAVQYTHGAIGCGDRYTVWRGRTTTMEVAKEQQVVHAEAI